MDDDGSGRIMFQELESFIRVTLKLGRKALSDAQMGGLWLALDQNRSGFLASHMTRPTPLLCCCLSAAGHATGEFLETVFCRFSPFCSNFGKSLRVNLFPQQSDLVQSFCLPDCHLFFDQLCF